MNARLYSGTLLTNAVRTLIYPMDSNGCNLPIDGDLLAFEINNWCTDLLYKHNVCALVTV